MLDKVKKVKLTRGQIGSGGGIDITVKSAVGQARAFAPTWAMVTRHKSGLIGDREYSAAYHQILSHVDDLGAVRWLYRLGITQGGQIKLLCYCRDGVFCHTHLAIDFLVKHYPNLFEDGRLPREDIDDEEEKKRDCPTCFGLGAGGPGDPCLRCGGSGKVDEDDIQAWDSDDIGLTNRIVSIDEEPAILREFNHSGLMPREEVERQCASLDIEPPPLGVPVCRQVQR